MTNNNNNNIDEKLLDTVVTIIDSSTQHNKEALKQLERVNKISMIKDVIVVLGIIGFFLVLYLF